MRRRFALSADVSNWSYNPKLPFFCGMECSLIYAIKLLECKEIWSCYCASLIELHKSLSLSVWFALAKWSFQFATKLPYCCWCAFANLYLCERSTSLFSDVF